jgi:hypothetical protein
MHANYQAAYEKCAGWMPHLLPAEQIGAPPRPGRLHPVPTRPVFGGGYEVF